MRIFGRGMVAALAGALLWASPAFAADIAVQPVNPTSGGGYTQTTGPYGAAPEYDYEAEWDGGASADRLFFEVATRNTPGQDGTFASEFEVDTGFLSRGDAFPTRWKGRWLAGWLTRPGTYYIQFYTYGGCAVLLCKSDVFPLTVAARAPAPAPYFPQSRAISTVRGIVRQGTGRSPRIRYRCRRASATRWLCSSTWTDRLYHWAMRFDMQTNAKNVVLYTANGLRASKACLKRSSVRRCARKVEL